MAAAEGRGAFIYIANADEGGKLDILSASGPPHPTGFDTAFDDGDHIAIGNVDDDADEEVLIADSDGSNPNGGRVDVHRSTFDSWVMVGLDDDEDGFVVGDLIDDEDGAEVIGADAADGIIQIHSGSGQVREQALSQFDDDDVIAIGNVTGDADKEIIIANADGGGRVDVLDSDGDPARPSFQTAFDDIDVGEIPDDMLLVGNVDGGEYDEILIANANDGAIGNGRVDVFDASDDQVTHVDGDGFDTSYDDTDGRDRTAIGDVTGDGFDDLVVANSEGNGRIDIYDLNADDGEINEDSFDLGGDLYDPGDGLAVGDAAQDIPTDIDNDGITDEVELDGIRDSDGNLMELGPDNEPVHPCRKDIVVEIDYMKADAGITHRPNATAIATVRDAFDEAPVQRTPDCPYADVPSDDGINLVVMVDDEIEFNVGMQLPGGFDDTKAEHFDADVPFVRYNVWARDATDENNSSEFAGRVSPGSAPNDFLVIPVQPQKQADGSTVDITAGAETQASIFMHELGHSIGLHHGGLTEESCKPNYLSVMNYLVEVGLTREKSGGGTETVFDFSHEDLDDLNEDALDEGTGLSKDGDTSTVEGMFTAWGTDPAAVDANGDPTGEPFQAVAGGAINWNNVNGIEDDVEFDLDENAANACDEAPNGEPLTGFDDWAFLNEGIGAWNSDDSPEELSALARARLAAFWDRVASPDLTLALDAPRPGFRATTQGVALDDEHIYATHFYERSAAPHTSDRPGSLVVLDRDTLEIEDRVEVGFKPTSVAVNPVTDRVYVVNRGVESFSLTIIDGATRNVIDTIDLHQGPIDVAVNTGTNRVYVSNLAQRLIHVIDGATDTLLAPIPIGPGPLGLAVDETTNTLYVALHNRSFEPHVTALGAVVDDGQTTQILPNVDLGAGGTQPVDVAVDPDAGRVYVAGLGGGGVAPSMIALDSATRQEIARVSLKAPARAIAVNGLAHSVYVAGEGGVDVIDDGIFQVIRSFPSALPFAIATESGLGDQVYVGELRTGALSRIATS